MCPARIAPGSCTDCASAFGHKKPGKTPRGRGTRRPKEAARSRHSPVWFHWIKHQSTHRRTKTLLSHSLFYLFVFGQVANKNCISNLKFKIEEKKKFINVSELITILLLVLSVVQTQNRTFFSCGFPLLSTFLFVISIPFCLVLLSHVAFYTWIWLLGQ